MTMDFRPRSAKLYQFPTRGRLAIAPRPGDSKPVAEMRAPQVVFSTAGSGWYHEAALQDAERSGKP